METSRLELDDALDEKPSLGKKERHEDIVEDVVLNAPDESNELCEVTVEAWNGSASELAEGQNADDVWLWMYGCASSVES